MIISVSLVIRNQLATVIILLVRTCSRHDYSLRTHMLARLTIHLVYAVFVTLVPGSLFVRVVQCLHLRENIWVDHPFVVDE